MAAGPEVRIPHRIIALMQERNRLFAYPYEQITGKIRRSGFRCTRCGKCCTQSVNSHVFLLDVDAAAAKAIDPASLAPAPGPEFCDGEGMLYVSGYALKRKSDKQKSCWFLDGNRCRIYDRRFSVCRIYPYMLRPGPNSEEHETWHQFAREGRHGEYGKPVTESECSALARGILEYENAFLSQQISFLEILHEFFSIHGLSHDPDIYARRMRRLSAGEPVPVRVFCNGEFEETVYPQAE